ncbi:hypothetical protein Clacol_010101 [Clathrus columnatus]|uniref:Uncharacterized protein n=1 Tax=Clathrus columnatus TaxID=1419009 RepID=A0AAV5AT60_9AGAM|nr:hypothetical protein Clacol_010101 [Clathrus columnatus]
MDDIVAAHSKDLEGLSHHLGKLASLFNDMKEKFLSKEFEYIMNVLQEFEKQNEDLTKSVEEWKARYYEAKGMMEAGEPPKKSEIGHAKLKEVDCIDGLDLFGFKLEGLYPNNSSNWTIPKGIVHSLPDNVGPHTKTASGSKNENLKGKEKASITPPELTTRKIITSVVKEDVSSQSSSQYQYPRTEPLTEESNDAKPKKIECIDIDKLDLFSLGFQTTPQVVSRSRPGNVGAHTKPIDTPSGSKDERGKGKAPVTPLIPTRKITTSVVKEKACQSPSQYSKPKPFKYIARKRVLSSDNDDHLHDGSPTESSSRKRCRPGPSVNSAGLMFTETVQEKNLRGLSTENE